MIYQKVIAFFFYGISLAILLLLIYALFKTNFSGTIFKYISLAAILYFVFVLIANSLLLLAVNNNTLRIRIFKFSFFLYFLIYITMMCGLLFKSGVDWKYSSLIEYYVENSNLIPFKTISFYFLAFVGDYINKSIVLGNIVGNILMFVPLDLFISIFFPSKIIGLKRKIFMFLFFIIVIEVIQLVTQTGFFDVDDIILNSIGFMTGYFLFRTQSIQKMIRFVFIHEKAPKSEDYAEN